MIATTQHTPEMLEARLFVAEHKVEVLRKRVERLNSILLDARQQLYDGYDETAFILLDNYFQASKRDEL